VDAALLEEATCPDYRAQAFNVRRAARHASAKASPSEKAVRSIGIFEHTHLLVRLALALAHDAESQGDLLAQVRKAFAELADPPLPDAEVQDILRKMLAAPLDDY
jgi:hypothetical protein